MLLETLVLLALRLKAHLFTLTLRGPGSLIIRILRIQVCNSGGGSGVNVTFIGKDDNYEPLTPEPLSNYVSIISIGKTVYYSLAMGIPAYMYDVDMLKGYVTKTNYLDNFTSNFAKKSPGRHKSPKEILVEISSGYDRAIADSSCLRENASRDFTSDKLLERFLEQLENCPNLDYEDLNRKWPTLRFTVPLFVDEYLEGSRNTPLSKLI